MLGWEFPPLISGGLGVATYGMVKALRASASIRLIVPRSPSSSLDNVRIVGVDRAIQEDLIREGRAHDLENLVAELRRIPLALSSYHSTQAILEPGEQRAPSGSSGATTARAELGRYFESRESYGPDVQRKVHLFSRLADLLSRNFDFRIIHAHDWVTYPAVCVSRRVPVNRWCSMYTPSRPTARGVKCETRYTNLNVTPSIALMPSSQ